MKNVAVIQEAINLAYRFRQGETFRPYVLNRVWLIVPAVLFFLSLGIACAAATVVAFASLGAWLALPGLLLAPAVLVGSLFLQLYVFFAWLEERALSRALGREPTPSRKALGALPEVPPVLAIAVLVAPLALLAVVAPALAGVLVLLAASTPFLYAYFDR